MTDGTGLTTLADAYLAEQARLRELLVAYSQIPTGRFATALIEDCLRRADRAAMERDVVKMIAIYEEMKGFKE